MRTDILTQKQKSALALLKDAPEVGKFYLAGGTALALHLGHRYSKDFDFFTSQDFDGEILVQGLEQRGACENVRQRPKTLFLDFDAIQCSFIFYQYPLLDVPSPAPWGFDLVTVREIGAMKIMAIGGRGRKRDFVDLYFIARDLGIEKVWQDFTAKYAGTGYDSYHFLRALTFFNDAEKEDLPEMIAPVDWNSAKKFFESEVKKIAP